MWSGLNLPKTDIENKAEGRNGKFINDYTIK